MDDHQRQPDGETGEAGRRDWVSYAENAHQKEERPHHLEHESRDEIVFPEVARAPAVLAKPAGPALSLAGQDEIEHHRGDDRAQNLSNPVADHVRDAQPAGDIDPETDCWIDVAAGDWADAVGHSDNGEAESARYAEKIDGRRARSHSANDRRPATEEYKGEGPDKFSDLFVHYPLQPRVRLPKAPL